MVMFVVLAASLVASALGQAAAPAGAPESYLAELAQRAAFEPEAYKWTFPRTSVNTAAGTIRPMDVSSNPFLGTLPNGGIAQNVDVWSPCTLNVVHVHPRANEIYYVIEGELQVGIQEEASAGEVTGRFINLPLAAGDNVVVPQGLLHYVYNPACSNVTLLQIWSNSDPGTVVAYANIVNNLPDPVLAALTGLDAAGIATIKERVPPPGSIVQNAECLAACPPPEDPAGRRRLRAV